MSGFVPRFKSDDGRLHKGVELGLKEAIGRMQAKPCKTNNPHSQGPTKNVKPRFGAPLHRGDQGVDAGHGAAALDARAWAPARPHLICRLSVV